ncbi:PH domain-containing protein, partial [Patescibacteria group bacterium]|nr:PH domain-containing protein [Patescibacteria group bacterium]
MNQEFLTKKSKGILALYWAIPIFMVALMIFVPFFSDEEMSRAEKMAFWVIFGALTIWFLIMIYRIYHMRYLINNGELTIYGPFFKIKLRLSDITEIKRAPLPAGTRLWGSSFVGGRYYIPVIGKTWMAMTNFQDGVLINTEKGGHYFITP